jgi:predicted DNA repair protein MutK
MATGLIALLDDVAAIAKVAAASVDDVALAAGRAGAKAAGVVIDDAAVTPRYVVGFAPARELPIIGQIALASLRNKLLVLLPAALLLSAFAPWAILPLLVVGGCYLCFEGAEKVLEWLFPPAAPAAGVPEATPLDALHLERQTVAKAIKTDFILSAEIMAIALSTVPEVGIWTQAAVLGVVGIAITAAVYGVVALIVKMDDVGLHMAARGGVARQALGRLIVRAMPVLLKVLSVVGTAAMIWVGGGIILHGMEGFGLGALPHWVHDIAAAAGRAAGGGAVEWAVGAALAGVLGLVVGAALKPVLGPLLHKH